MRDQSCGKTIMSVSMCAADVHEVEKWSKKVYTCKKNKKNTGNVQKLALIRQRQSMCNHTHTHINVGGFIQRGSVWGGLAGNSFYSNAG